MTMTATRAPEASAARAATRTVVAPARDERRDEPRDERRDEPSAPPRKQRSAVARVLGLSDLMSRRPDLHGVYPPADVAAEAVCWSA
jgi:hypothetical protein